MKSKKSNFLRFKNRNGGDTVIRIDLIIAIDSVKEGSRVLYEDPGSGTLVAYSPECVDRIYSKL